MEEEYNFEAVGNAIERHDYDAAVRLTLPHAQAGNSDAQCEMALLYQAGWGVSRDFEQAEQWLLKAAAQDNPVAWNNLGTFYATTGRREKALQCYERAKELGFDVCAVYPPPI